jgi:hypothetical protein
MYAMLLGHIKIVIVVMDAISIQATLMASRGDFSTCRNIYQKCCEAGSVTRLRVRAVPANDDFTM